MEKIITDEEFKNRTIKNNKFVNDLLHGETEYKQCRKEKMMLSLKTHEQFLDEMSYISPHITILGKYDDLLGLGGSKLSYDFYIPNNNLLIEYQVEFHDGTARQQTEEEYNKQKKNMIVEKKNTQLKII